MLTVYCIELDYNRYSIALRVAELISVAFARQGIWVLTEACPELVRGRWFPTLANKAKGGGSPTKGRRKRPPGKVDSYYFSDP